MIHLWVLKLKLAFPTNRLLLLLLSTSYVYSFYSTLVELTTRHERSPSIRIKIKIRFLSISKSLTWIKITTVINSVCVTVAHINDEYMDVEALFNITLCRFVSCRLAHPQWHTWTRLHSFRFLCLFIASKNRATSTQS